jgi:ABC-type phosphate/phosphonate transport system substrate-binding protein
MQTEEIMAKARLLILLAASLLGGPTIPRAAIAQQVQIQIGLAKTFLSEQPKGIAEIAADDFKGVVKKTTGLDGAISSKLGAFEIAEKLDGKQLDFGIFHAHEFAWVQKKYPRLVPLLIATDKYRVEKAYVIVHKNSSAKTFADLRGKKLDLPVGTKEHCRVFLDQICTDKDTKGPATFFGAIEKSATKKDALDNVAREKVDATVIDRNGLEFYKEIRGPVFEKNLRILAESADFPPAVVAYKPGTLEQKTVDQFRDGLLKAHTVPEGRDMMKSWHIQEFQPIPKDYAKSLADVMKAYPPR